MLSHDYVKHEAHCQEEKEGYRRERQTMSFKALEHQFRILNRSHANESCLNHGDAVQVLHIFI